MVGVSVKEYYFYNNEIGYTSGSLGGGGKVVSAIPQMFKTLSVATGNELLTQDNQDGIITVLLNSFPDSVIGVDNTIINDILQFLLVGAALLFFDDGFTAGTAFLQKIQENLSDVGNINSLHLLLSDLGGEALGK